MTGVFFAVHPVWWVAPIALSSILIALLSGGAVGLLWWIYSGYRARWFRWAEMSQQRTRYSYHRVDISRDDYAELMLIEIRRYLTYTYQPQHSWAHIPERIASYTQDARLIEIVRTLEQVQYSKQDLTNTEKETLNNELSIKLKIR